MEAHDLERYNRDGYHVARGLFSPAEIDTFRAHYRAMHDREAVLDTSRPDAASANASLNDVAGIPTNDPLRAWPRMMMMHRRDRLSMDFLLDARLNRHLTALMGREPYAVQTMMYWKPPHARGQALHQDQYYLRVRPGTCMAAWLALDDCDEENGCLAVVPGSQDWPLLCLTAADTSKSFTDVTVDLPAGVQAVPVFMKAGDVLFFNGQIVHGSGPNTSDTRFRRALIAHYIAGDANEVYRWYKPAYRMDGSEVDLGTSEIGGTCGTWVDADGSARLELSPEAYSVKIFGPH
jgi:ectoine hydroxylase-related dioxygenase (phytanoyl-CoA dioxygenase family)